MEMDLIAGSGNDEFYTLPYAIYPILKYIRSGSTIWCPFDTEDSFFVKIFRRKGYKVVNSHISSGEDFFAMKVPECDYIISNPPYSLKTEVLQRLFSIDKPFAMLIGVVGLFENRKRFDMFRANEFEVMYFDKRIRYFDESCTLANMRQPPFSSIYLCHKILPKQIVFEELDRDNQLNLFE
jgi:hypothetical protein